MPFPVVHGLRSIELGHPGPMRQRLVGLVLAGLKQATAGLLTEYQTEGEPVEHVGERLVILGDDGSGVAVVEVTAAEICGFAEVPWAFAAAEGEGERDIQEWREGHLRFWTGEGERITDSTPVVLVWFTLVERLGAASPA